MGTCQNGPMSTGGSLAPCGDAAEASWIAPRLMSFASGVGAWVPPVFDAYVRILHPALLADGGPVRWAEVAEWSGGTVHALAQFHQMSRPRGPDLPAPPFAAPPRSGVLEPGTLDAMCETLVRRTATPDLCYFGVWEGFGWTPTVAGSAARLELPERGYLLFRGPLSAIGDLGWSWSAGFGGASGFNRESPSIVWPSDRSWFVATEVDLDSTLVGGSVGLVDELLADERLEAWPVSATDPTDAGSDSINRE